MEIIPPLANDELIRFLKRDYANNLYFFNYIRNISRRNPPARILTATENGAIVAAVLISPVHCCISATNESVIDQVAARLPSINSHYILGRYDFTDRLLDNITGPERKKKTYSFCRLNPEKLPYPDNALSEKASPDDYLKLVSFYRNNDMLLNCEERLDYILNSGTAYLIRENDTVVSCALTTTETGDMAMVGSVFTVEDRRKHGFARGCIMNLCRKLVERNKSVHLFYESENKHLAGLYNSLGFEETGKWLLASLP